jgi:uncharacterized protein (TIGR02996 family)
MDPVEERLLAAIRAATPEDEAPHKAYADWLREKGRLEEAAYQARWTAEVGRAERWLADFAIEAEIPYEEVLEAARNYAKNGETHVPSAGGDFGAQHLLYGNDEYNREGQARRAEFWKAIELVEGKSIEESVKETGYVFDCRC